MIISAFRSAFGQFAATTWDPVHPRDPAIKKMFGVGNATSAGVPVDEDSALAIPAFWRGVNILSNSIGKIPANCYRREGDDGRKRDRQHPADRLLRKRPGIAYSPFVFKRTLQSHALIYGNGFAYVNRDGAARPKSLVILPPSQTVVGRLTEELEGIPSGAKIFLTYVNGQRKPLLAENVIHIYGLGSDGTSGAPVVELLRESLGLGVAAQQFGAKFFGNGANASGVITHPGRLSEPAAKNLRESFAREYAGLSNSQKQIVLEEGMKYDQLTIPPEQAQFLETREFQTREVANILNIQSHKIGDQSRKSYNSLEQSNQEHLDDDLDPWLVQWEEELGDKLLTEAEKESDSHYIEFNRNALQRIDSAGRAATYANGRQWGYLSVNDIRRSENMEPIGPEGDVYLVPSNMVPADQAGQIVDMGAGQRGKATPTEISPDAEGDADEEAAELGDVDKWVIAQARERITKQAEAKRGKPGFDAWLAAVPEEQGPPALHSHMAAMIRELKIELAKGTEA